MAIDVDALLREMREAARGNGATVFNVKRGIEGTVYIEVEDPARSISIDIEYPMDHDLARVMVTRYTFDDLPGEQLVEFLKAILSERFVIRRSRWLGTLWIDITSEAHKWRTSAPAETLADPLDEWERRALDRMT